MAELEEEETVAVEPEKEEEASHSGVWGSP